MKPEVGDAVYVRLPSMHPRGFQDVPGRVSKVLPGDRYNVKRRVGPKPVANGQPVCGPGVTYGIVTLGSDEWCDLNVVT